MKGHVIILVDVLKMFPAFVKNGLTKYKFADDSENSPVLVMVNDVTALITNTNRNIMLATYVTYFDTELIINLEQK